MLNDVTNTALHSAMTGLAARQRVIADNVANIQTPGFLAGRVQFEDALRSAVGFGTGSAAPTTARSLEPTRLDGNNVNLDREVLSNIDTGLRYQLVVKAMDDRFSLLRSSLRTQS
ncbi:flagellar basal body rod protein FlgB [Thalassiella azotivora]